MNLTGHESGLPEMSAKGDLPILQDTPEQDVWTSWGVVWRDVILVDEDNVRIGVYNLTTHNLSDSANREELKALFVTAATD